jgi:hypothetical protein
MLLVDFIFNVASMAIIYKMLKNDDQPLKDLAKFSYKSNMKSKKLNNLIFSQLQTETQYRNLKFSISFFFFTYGD